MAARRQRLRGVVRQPTPHFKLPHHTQSSGMKADQLTPPLLSITPQSDPEGVGDMRLQHR